MIVLGYFLLLGAWANLFNSNCCYSVFMLLYILLPIMITYLLNCKKRLGDFCDTLKFFLDKSAIFSVILFAILLFMNFIDNFIILEDDMHFVQNLFYYASLIFSFIYINYYSINSSSYKEDIKLLMNITTHFFKDKIILSLFLVIAIFFFPKDNGFLYGIVGSYVFFFFQTVNDKYEEMRKKESLGFQILIIIILNIFIVFYLADFEAVFFAIRNNSVFTIDYKILIRLLLVIPFLLLGHFYNKLILLKNKLQKFFVKK